MRLDFWNEYKQRDWTVFTILLAAYFVVGKLGLQLALINESATAVWPASGVALAAFLIFGYRYWPSIFIGAFLVNLTTSWSVPINLLIAVGNTLEGLAAVYLINRYALGRQVFDHPHSIFSYTIIVVFATMISPFIGVTSLLLGGLASLGNYWNVWLTWWIGDLGGALIFAPLFITWSRRSRRFADRRYIYRGLEVLLVFLVLVIITYFVFSLPPTIRGNAYPLEFLGFPILTWIAFRLGRRASTLATSFIAIFAIDNTLRGLGPFAGHDTNESLILLQVLMGTLTITTTTLAAAVLERDEAEKRKSDFFSMATHQLRTPLGVIKWSIESLLKNKKDKLPPETKRIVQRVDKANKVMIEQLEEMLRLVRSGEGLTATRLKTIDLIEVIRSVLEQMEPEIRRKSLAVHFPFNRKSIPLVNYSSFHLNEVLHNLISNAVKYNKDQGRVAIEIKEKKDKILIEISDTGIGIPKEEQGKIFDEFFRTSGALKKKVEGTGLGLSLVYSYIKNWGGKIWFDSREGRGTTFYVQLTKKINRKI